jgi:DNA-binding NtrC family response regulator
MPKMGGHELAKRMVALRPGLRVLYMSGYAEYASAPEHNSCDGGFRLQKPFSMGALAHKVREVLNVKHPAEVRPQ